MADQTLPVSAEPTLVQTNPGLSGTAADGWQTRLSAFTNQPAFRRALPALIGVGALAAVALVYLAIAGSPQRILYASLTDGERASVVQALETGAISYQIDNATGAITVAEDDIYRARMLVASDAGLAAPQGASEMLDAIPLGSSRTLEGERLRLARERELMLTIREIDGIEAVRVHLATPERSVFVRSSNSPSASVMLRLVSGRSLSQRQVEAIVNLVSGSVPGLTADAVRVVDQNGRLLSAARDTQMEGLALQREFESKLQGQLATLLTPLLGEGNFSSQVQVELDQSEVTSARETYDKEGAVRSENERNVTRMAARQPGGVPGVTANTPPPEANLLDGPPQGDAPANAEAQAQTPTTPSDTESAIQRAYELDREVAVTARRAGGLTKLSVAVAVSQEAMVAAAPLTPEELEALVSAAVGADTARGDMVKIAVSAFESSEIAPLEFYEESWFAQVLRYGTALIAVLLVLMLAVRPMLASVSPKMGKAKSRTKTAKALSAGGDGQSEAGENALTHKTDASALTGPAADPYADLPEQVRLARTLASEQPERALDALQRMLQPKVEKPEKAAG
ncbi:MAG: flagellar basal-body MS-ring/collar protein FliF [Pseudomonadota bacterium]